MPAWLRAEDEDKWAKAKAAAKESYPDLSEEDDKFWAIVTSIFKDMGGKPGKKSLCETLVVVLPSKRAPVRRLVLKSRVKGHYRTRRQTGKRYYVGEYVTRRMSRAGLDHPLLTDSLGFLVPEVELSRLSRGLYGSERTLGYGLDTTTEQLGRMRFVWRSLEDARRDLHNAGFEVSEKTVNLHGDYKVIHIRTAREAAKREAESETKWQGGRKVYVRYGKLPPGDRSRNYADNALESGVSVYEGEELPTGEVRVIPRTNQEDVGRLFIQNRPLYVVEGQYIGTGSDGEPVLRNARIVREVRKAVRLVVKGHKLHYQTDFQGISVSVENRKGSIRRGKQKDGKEWETKMFWPYGRIPYTKGKDGEAVDCFIGPNKESQKVFVVHQRTPDGEHYDEDKCLLGFDDEEHARDAFLAHYDSQKFLGEITEMGIDEFKEKLAETREHPKMLKSLPRLVLKALPYHLEGGEGSAHRGSRHSPGKGATKTRHYRIPERATKLREAHGKVGGHDVRIQLFRDYDRYFFTAWRDDWRRMVVKQISGRNLATAERWWNENAQEIGAEAINLESLAKSLPYHLEGGAGSSHKGSKRRVGKRSPRVKSDAERLGVTKSTPKPWKVLGVLYPVMSEFVSGREQYATVERVLAHARLNYLTPQEVQVQVRRYLLDLAAVHALRFKSARPLMIWIDPTKEDQPYVRGKYWPQEAALEVTNKTAESIVHEFGHYLAYEVLDPTVLHSVGERLRYLPEVDRGAAEIDERARMTGDILHGSAYWRSDQELWARAYEHWATKRLAPDSSLRAALYEYHKPDPGKLAVWWDESADWVDRTVDKVMGQYTKEVEKALALWLDKALPYHLEGGQGSSHRGAKRRLGKQTVKQSRAEKFGGPGTFSANAAKVITGESPVTAGSDWFLKQQRDYLRERLQKLDALVDEVESKGMTREPWLEYAYFKGARDYLREILGVQETPSGPEVAPTPVTPPPEAPPVAAVAKEPWEMTRQEYYNWTADGMEQQAQRAADELAKPTRAWTPSRMRDIEQPRLSAEKLRKGDATGLPDLEGHRRAQIEHAAAQGKIGEGIKDYPDLQAKHRKSPRLELSLRNPTRSVSRGIPGMPKGYSHSFADFAQGRQIGIHRGDELIMVANWNKGKPDDIEFTEPKYLKINKIRQSAIHALRAAVRHHA